MTLTEITREASQLPPDEVATLIDALFDRIAGTRDPEIDTAWASEAEDRVDAFDRGEIPSVDGPAAISSLRQRLRSLREDNS